jgi:hypothetical protein
MTVKVCQFCSGTFSKPYSPRTVARLRFCSRECSANFRRKTAEERFDEKWVGEPNSGCWLWTGGLTKSGYGSFGADTNWPMRAHRYSYLRFNGPIPDGQVVRHKCDVMCCVNPKHLEVGTQADNMNDAKTRGRMKGKCGRRKPTELTREMRLLEWWRGK